jgi:hypothetical protein
MPRVTHLVIRFFLELAALAGAIAVGASVGNPPLGFPGGVLAGVAFVVVWALWIAPRARFALAPMARLVIGTAIMVGVAIGLIVVGQPTIGEILVAAVVANAVLLVLTHNVGIEGAGGTGR